MLNQTNLKKKKLKFCMLQVVTEGRLILEFTFDDLMRIRSWHFQVRQHRELIPRSVIAMQVGYLCIKSGLCHPTPVYKGQ